MSRRRVLRIVVALASGSVGLVLIWGLFRLPPIRPHRGDGTIKDLSWRPGGIPIPVPGYAVSLPAFDLGEPHEGEYHVADLPDIRRDCTFYLAIDDPNGPYEFNHDLRGLTGRLRLELVDDRGEVIGQADGPVKEWRWGYWRGANRLHQMDALRFRPGRGREYTLRMSWSGDLELAGWRGYGYLECGARL